MMYNIKEKIKKEHTHNVPLYSISGKTWYEIIKEMDRLSEVVPVDAVLNIDRTGSWDNPELYFSWYIEETDEEYKQRIESEKHYLKTSIEIIEKQKLDLQKKLEELE